MPVEDLNKPLDIMEKRIYKKRGFIVFVLEAVLVILSIVFHINYVSNCLQMVWVILNIMLFIVIIKNNLIKNI